MIGRDMYFFQNRVASWHKDAFPDRDKKDILAKLTEEVGEVARALVGELEGRANRGDVCDEAAQCVLVLATLVSRYPDRNLFEDAQKEISRLQGNEDDD